MPERSIDVDEITRPPSPSEEGFRVTAALIANDLWIILLAYPLLILPSMVVSAVEKLSLSSILILATVERLTYLAFLGYVTVRWVRRFSTSGRHISSSSYIRFALFGIVAWLLIVAPLMSQRIEALPQTKLFLLLLLLPATVFILKHFFYNVAVFLMDAPLRSVLELSSRLSRGRATVGFKTLVGPLGLVSLLVALVMTTSPDGRNPTVTYITNLIEGIYWILITYLSIGVGFTQLETVQTPALQLDPYLSSRLKTVSLHSSRMLAKIIGPKAGSLTLVISLLLWTGNIIRASETPPEASIAIQRLAVAPGEIQVTLLLKDEKFHFNAFAPSSFMVAGETGTIVSASPSRATLSTGEDVLAEFPRTGEGVTLILSFPTERRLDELIKLEDLHLWYRRAKLSPLDMKTAEVANSKVSPSQSEHREYPSGRQSDLHQPLLHSTGGLPLRGHSRPCHSDRIYS